MRAWCAGVFVVVMTLAGCGGSSSPATSPSDSSGQTGPTGPTTTAALDSIAVIGHSGATGTQSDPNDPSRDAHENSWATGENPDVDSVYTRLLADHPALKGHNYNAAVNGTAVDDLLPQLDSVLATAKPLPDVVLVQSIDNDIQCDGSDSRNLRPYAAALDAALTQMEKKIPHVQVFLVSQWATVASYVAVAAHHPEGIAANSGPGPCQLFRHGKPYPKGIGTLQSLVGAYWHQLVTVCSKHAGCFTDGGIEQRLVPTDEDLTPDENHLTIAGQAKFADLAWQALPEEIKERK